jgi:hypothetical protein
MVKVRVRTDEAGARAEAEAEAEAEALNDRNLSAPERAREPLNTH